MDIASSEPWPAKALSNFAAHDFIFEGEVCASMEGFLQSLKFEDEDEARAVRALSGSEAKARGGVRNEVWQRSQTLWWLGWPLERGGLEYQALLSRAFLALYTQNEEARSALLATHAAEFSHSIGETNSELTVLTSGEFCRLLLETRGHLSRHYLQLYGERDMPTVRMSRYRRGSRRSARNRERECSTCLDLVSLIGYGGPARIDFSTSIADYNSLGGIAGCDGSIAIDATVSLYDQAYMYAHEAGHVFDMAFLSDELRNQFALLLGWKEGEGGPNWTAGAYEACLQEAFADAYARLSCVGPWYNEWFAGRYWDHRLDRQVLSASAIIIEQASRRAPAIEVRKLAEAPTSVYAYVPTRKGWRYLFSGATRLIYGTRRRGWRNELV